MNHPRTLTCFVCKSPHYQMRFTEARRLDNGAQVWIYNCEHCKTGYLAAELQGTPIVARLELARASAEPLPGRVVHAHDLLALNPMYDESRMRVYWLAESNKILMMQQDIGEPEL